MTGLSRALSYLIAAQFQALGLIIAAWLIGQWLNEKHPIDFNWYAVTFPVAVVGIFHSFYVVIRYTMKAGKNDKTKSELKSSGGSAE